MNEGTLKPLSDYVVRFERRLNQPVEQVWAALTQPEQLAQWLAHTDVTLTGGSKIDLRFDNTGSVIHGTVTQFNPPNVLEYTWDSQDVPQTLPRAALLASGNGTCTQELAGSLVRWELNAVDGGTMLVLSHTVSVPRQGRRPGQFPDRPQYVLASWHTHLDALTNTLDSQFRGLRPAAWPDVWSQWGELSKRYAQTLG
jgi:uncharacterized protein YndB with AHSA1/START domain